MVNRRLDSLISNAFSADTAFVVNQRHVDLSGGYSLLEDSWLSALGSANLPSPSGTVAGSPSD